MKKKLSKKKIILFSIITLSLSLLLGFLLVEIFARYFFAGPFVTGSLIVDDPELAFSLRKGVNCLGRSPEFNVNYATDTQYGFRAEKTSSNLSKEPDVVFYGDSFVFGHGVEHHELFSTLMQNKPDGINLLNAGIFNFGPDQEFLLARRLRKQFSPKLEVACFFIGNDFTDFDRFKILKFDENGAIIQQDAQDPAGKTRRAFTSLFFYPWLCKLYSWHLFKAVVIEKRFQNSENSNQKVLNNIDVMTENERKNIHNMASMYLEWQKDAKGNLIVFIIPDINYSNNENSKLSLLKKELEILGVKYFDLGKRLPREVADRKDLYFKNDGHWTSKGHEWAAEKMRPVIVNELITNREKK